MVKENDIKEELLKQMDKDSDKIPEANTMSTKEIIERDTARIKRLKWVTICCWLLVGVCFIAAKFLEQLQDYYVLIAEHLWFNYLIIILRVLLVIAIFLTISLYIRSRTLTLHRIQIGLSNIEMLLKQMAQDK